MRRRNRFTCGAAEQTVTPIDPPTECGIRPVPNRNLKVTNLLTITRLRYSCSPKNVDLWHQTLSTSVELGGVKLLHFGFTVCPDFVIQEICSWLCDLQL